MNIHTLKLTDDQLELILFALNNLSNDDFLCFARDNDLSPSDFHELYTDTLSEFDK